MLILVALLAIGQPPATDVEKPGTATLRGHVLAADTGRPLRKEQVRIFAGEIRLFGITPGQYYLQATWRSNMGFGVGGENQPAYAPMFFPGVLEASEARRFTIGVSQQLSDLVMALKPTKAVRVSGTVLSSD